MSREPNYPSIWIRGFLDNPEAFQRKYEHTNGKPWPKLPLKVVCRECRSSVGIWDSECGECGEPFHWKTPRPDPCKNVARQSKQGPTPERSAVHRRYYGGMCPVREGVSET